MGAGARIAHIVCSLPFTIFLTYIIISANKFRNGRDGLSDVKKAVYREGCKRNQYGTPSYKGPCYYVNCAFGNRTRQKTTLIREGGGVEIKRCGTPQECTPQTLHRRVSDDGRSASYNWRYPKLDIIIVGVLSALCGINKLYGVCEFCLHCVKK